MYSVASGKAKIFALAPEPPGLMGIICHAIKDGVIVAAAYSDTTYERAISPIQNAVKHFTHLFNGMRVFHHRDSGIVGAALVCQGVTVEVIADGVHLHPAVLRLVLQAKGSANVCLVTDAICATGLQNGTYCFVDQEVVVSKGIARLRREDSLAGSTLTLDQAIRNLVQWGIPLTEAIRMASTTPARLLGVHHTKGSIMPGKDTDLVVLDRDLTVRAVVIKGEVVYNN